MRQCPDDRRLLFVGQLFAHKNVGVVFQALVRVRERFPAARLFLAGPRHDRIEPPPGVKYLGFVPDTTLAQAYDLATLLVMPSLYETAGLPMLEAMNAGTPVLAANRPYARDICNDAAVYFDPLSYRDLAAKIERLLTDSLERNELAVRGRDLARARIASDPYGRLVAAALEVAHCRSSERDEPSSKF